MIHSGDISVIVQGSINATETPKCLESIREFLPDAEIILSTWEGSDISNLDYDILVLSSDPGAVLMEGFTNKTVYNNINRQLLSTQAGLKKATRKYAMKFRSDLILTGDKFLSYFEEFQSHGEKYNLFKRKILGSVLFTKYNIKSTKKSKRVEIPFHISDWWLFGLKEDLDTYFLETQLVKEPCFTNYFSHPENREKSTPYGKAKFKFSPEQYFGYSCFARNFADIYMEDAADVSDALIEKSRQCLVNNFIFLEFEQSGIYLNKYPYSKNEKFAGEQYLGLYNFFRYENEYKKYCDKNYKITDNKFFKNEKTAYAILRLYKHISRFTDAATPFSVKLEQLFLSIPVAAIKYCAACLSEILRRKK